MIGVFVFGGLSIKGHIIRNIVVSLVTYLKVNLITLRIGAHTNGKTGVFIGVNPDHNHIVFPGGIPIPDGRAQGAHIRIRDKTHHQIIFIVGDVDIGRIFRRDIVSGVKFEPNFMKIRFTPLFGGNYPVKLNFGSFLS